MFMAIARAAASRSTCCRLAVGAVVVDERYRILSLGYNGAPSGMPHCTGLGCRYFQPTGCQVVHAERNAVERAGESLALAHTLYVTHSPCRSCSEVLRGVVQRVFFEVAYRDPAPVAWLRAEGVEVLQVLPSGLCVDGDGALCEPR